MASQPPRINFRPQVLAPVDLDEYNPIDGVVRQSRDREISINIQQAKPAHDIAKANRLARRFQENPVAVEENMEFYEKLLKSQAALALSALDDVWGEWAAQNPREAAISAEDTKALTGLAGFWDDVKKVMPRVGGGVYDLGAAASDLLNTMQDAQNAIASPIHALIGAVGRAHGLDGLDPKNYLREQRKRNLLHTTALNAEAERIAEENKGNNRITEGLLQGVRSLPYTAAAMLTGSAAAGGTVFGLLSGADSYVEAREQGVGVGESLAYAVGTGAMEGGSESFALGRWLEVSAGKVPFVGGAMRALVTEMTGEQINTVISDMLRMVHLPENEGKTVEQFIAERPDAFIDTALAVVGGSGATAAAIKTTQAAGNLASRVVEARDAKARGKALDRAVKEARESKLRAEDPEAFREYMRRKAEAAGAQDVYIPAEAIRAYQQSDAYDPDNDPFDPRRWELDDLAANGQDLVIPFEDFFTDIAPTPAFEALKDDIRFVGGAMSVREAMEAEEALADVSAQLEAEFEAEQRAEREGKSIRDRLVDRVAGQFGASYTAPVARQIAELAAAREETRAARMGRTLSLQTLSDLEVRQVMPESARQIKAADQLDLVINAMQQGKPARYGRGDSLIKFLRGRGGLLDTGGDLRAMGAPRGLIRNDDIRQGSILGPSGLGQYGLDNALRAAVEAGYFPELDFTRGGEFADELDVNTLLEAISEEMAGNPRYTEWVDDNIRAAADDLGDALRSAGFDPANMTEEQIREAVDTMMVDNAMDVGGAAYEQEALPDTVEVDGVTRGTVNSNGQPLGRTIEEVENFWRWFKDSRVVDDQGRPLVVYHGTASKFGEFSKSADVKHIDLLGFYFTPDPEIAGRFAESASRREFRDEQGYIAGYEDAAIMPVYLSIQNPTEINLDDAETGRMTRSADVRTALVAAQKADHDGAIIRGWADGSGETQYVAFTPEQIKSVNNRGTYDPNDARILNQFAGMNAETADHTKRREAAKMLEAGRSPESVRRETGWFKGVDGQWRFEISDHESEVRLGGLDLSADDLTLDDILKHDRLYAAYPTLRLMPVSFKEIGGLGSTDGFSITVSAKLEDDPELLRSVLLHEIQHAIQKREDFARGGSEAMAEEVRGALQQLALDAGWRANAREADARGVINEIAELQRRMRSLSLYQGFEALIRYANSDKPSSVFRHIRNETQWLHTPDLRDNPETAARARDLYYRLHELPRRGDKRNAFLRDYAFDLAQVMRDAIPPEHFKAIREDTRQVKSAYKAMEREVKKRRSLLEPLQTARKEASAAKAQAEYTAHLSSFEIYQLLAGEVEARNTQTRADLTDEQRVDRSPDSTATRDKMWSSGQIPVTPEQQIVVGQDGSMTTRIFEQTPDMVMNQERAESQPRGRIVFDQNKRVIELFEGRNISTAIHELSHMWLEDLQADAGHAAILLAGENLDPARRASLEKVARDWEATKKYFADNGHAVGADGVIPVEAHELWARSGERYIMEGKAPAGALTELFRSFAAFMKRIYKAVDALRAPITPEIREVFDRLIATDQEIEAAREVQGLSALFDDAAAAGMSEQEFDVYQRLIAKSRESAESKLLAKVMRAITVRETKLYKERADAIREDVEEALDRTPLFRALNLMAGKRAPKLPKVAAGSIRLWESPDGSGWQRNQGEAEFYVDVKADNPALKNAGDREILLPDELSGNAEPIPTGDEAMRISRQWIVDRMGADALKLLPTRVPPLYADGGIDPQIVAERAGYASADEMLNAIIGAEKVRREARDAGDKRPLRKRMVDDSVKEEMMRRHGDPLTDGSIEREALEAVRNDEAGELMATELRVLGRSSGSPVRITPWRVAKAWARNKVRSGEVRSEASASAVQRYQRAAAKASREAEAALATNDREGAFAAKHRQMMNAALASEAAAALREVEAAVARMNKIAKARTRASIDQDYLERAQALLEQIDLKRRSQILIDRAGKFEEWANEQRANGIDIITPEGFEAVLANTNWSRMSVNDLLTTDETIKQILHLGSLKQTLKDAQEARAFEEVISEAEIVASDIGRKALPSHLDKEGLGQRLKNNILSMDAALLKMEQVFLWLDNGNSNGAFNRYVFKPLADAQERSRQMQKEYQQKIVAHMEALPADVKKRWADKVSTPFVYRYGPKSGQPVVLERSQVIAMALNWGNAGNRQRLVDGEGWNETAVEAFLLSNLDQAEWQFVQNVWDTVGELWPHIQQVERNVNGFAPEEVESVPFETPFGTMRGGYYPAVYDPRGSLVAEDQKAYRDGLLGINYTRATTRASATKERAEAVKGRPLLLDLAVISRHLGEVIHDVTHREALIQAHKFLSNPRIRQLTREVLNPEIEKSFKPWLNYIANSMAHDRAGLGAVAKFLRAMRAHVTVVAMGWRWTTFVSQLAGFSNAKEFVRADDLAKAMARTTKDPIKTWDFVRANSQEMAGRAENLDVNIAAMLSTLDNPISDKRKKVATAAKRFAFHGIGYMDRVVTVPVWMAAYDRAVIDGMSHDQAVYKADQTVRLSQGASGAKDLAAVQTGMGTAGELVKSMTFFYTYFSAFYNRQRNLGRDFRRIGSAKEMPALLARAWWLLIAPPLLAELLAGRGPDEDDDEGYFEWAMKAISSQFVGGIPMLRDAYPIVWDKLAGNQSFGYRMSPLTGGVESGLRLVDDLKRVWEGKETKRMTRNAIETLGYATGLTTGQMGATAQFLVDVAEGDAQPQSFGEWIEGLIKGKIE